MIFEYPTTPEMLDNIILQLIVNHNTCFWLPLVFLTLLFQKAV